MVINLVAIKLLHHYLVKKIDLMSLGNEYDAEPMSTDMLEDIFDGSKSHLSINSR